MNDAMSDAPKRKRMQVFFRDEAVELDHDMMPLLGMDESVKAGLASLSAGGFDPRSGGRAVVLFREPGEHGMCLSLVSLKQGFVQPRHSHDGDCLYCVIDGALLLGARTLRKGDGFFVPAETAYTYEAGPEGVEILEFRNATRFTLSFRNNEPAHWARMAAAVMANGAAWAAQTELPSRQ
jgi:quercetin dioxygenase-like cupin family protein